MAFTGTSLPIEIQQVWQAVAGARDAAFDLIKHRQQKAQTLCGYEVDEAARQHIMAAGFGEFFIHRTGHSIQKEVHARGVNIDGFELTDTRPIIPDCGFSLEPGVYLPEKFGIRSEIDVYIAEDGQPQIYTLLQQQIALI